MKISLRIPLRILFLTALILVVTLVSLRPRLANAQYDEITWSYPINVSNSPDATSTDAFLLADPSGLVHLFWAEKLSDIPTNQPDTLMYTQWDGEVWTKPIDLFFAPFSDGTPVIGYPHALIDDTGILHLIWMSQPNFPYYTLNYSSVPSSEAGSAQAWQPKRELATDLTGTHYSIDFVYESPGTLHLVYARGAQGDIPKEDRSVAYMRSTDSGKNWSEPIDLFTTPVASWGASHTRIVFGAPENVYISWTVWDETGNGRLVFFIRSRDHGKTWDEPVLIAEKQQGEYERDWNQLVVLDKNEIMAMWEGGYRAYRYARYSSDGGATWGEAIDTFPGLIGENGFTEFARDSNNTLHLFIAQRLREGSTNPRASSSGAPSNQPEETLWHSTWLGGTQWREPSISGGYYAMINPKVVISKGNEVVATWYAPPTYEIFVMRGKIENSPAIATVEWSHGKPAVPPTQSAPLTALMTTPSSGPSTPIIPANKQQDPSLEPGVIIFVGVIPVLIAIPMLIFLQKKRR